MIGIGGLARAGKDTLAKHLSDIISEDMGFNVKILSFADQIKWQVKDICCDNYGISPYTQNTEEKKIVRDILVCHGETMKKLHGETIWADLIIEKIKKSKEKIFAIIPDVRFDYEVKSVKDNEGSVIHIQKIGNKPPNEIEAKNDPLVQKVADICHSWPVYEPDQMDECKDHAQILYQMLKETNFDKWKKIYN